MSLTSYRAAPPRVTKAETGATRRLGGAHIAIPASGLNPFCDGFVTNPAGHEAARRGRDVHAAARRPELLALAP